MRAETETLHPLHVGIRNRHLEKRHVAGFRIEDRHVVARVFGRAEQRPIGIDGRVAPVRRDQIMGVGALGAPLPGGDHDVALDALRPRRLALWQLALGDAVGPLPERFQRYGVEETRLTGHFLAGQPGLHAAHPVFLAGFERSELRRNRTGGLLAQLVAADAADILHLPQKIGLLRMQARVI